MECDISQPTREFKARPSAPTSKSGTCGARNILTPYSGYHGWWIWRGNRRHRSQHQFSKPRRITNRATGVYSALRSLLPSPSTPRGVSQGNRSHGRSSVEYGEIMLTPNAYWKRSICRYECRHSISGGVRHKCSGGC